MEQQANLWAMEAYNLKKKGDEDWKIYMEAAEKLGFEGEEQPRAKTGEQETKLSLLNGKWSCKYTKTGHTSIIEFDRTGEILSGTSIRFEKAEGAKLYYRAPNKRNRGFVINLNDLGEKFSVQEYKDGEIIFEKLR